MTSKNEPRPAVIRAELRLVLGFFLLPPAAGLLMFLTCVALMAMDAWVFEGTPSVDAATSMGAGVGLLAVPVAGLAAVPAVVWLIRRGQLSFRNLLLAGGLVGNAPFAIIIISTLTTQFLRGTLSADVGQLWFGGRGASRAILLGLWIGGALATLLWIVAIRGSAFEKPDRRSIQAGPGPDLH